MRLRQGEAGSETFFGDDPAAQARSFVEDGATWLHVVDLDGAFAGTMVNLHAIRAIVAAAGSVPVEVGGGLRDLAAIERVLDVGARWAMLGTAALRQPALVKEAVARWPGRIAAGIDAREGKVAVSGWTDTSEVLALDLARALADAGVSHLVFTDIAKDGMLQGPNLEATVEVARLAGIPVLASGGVSCAADVRLLAAVAHEGVRGVVVGRALYDQRLDLASILKELSDENVMPEKETK